MSAPAQSGEALVLAAEQEQLDHVKELLAQGTSINTRAEYKYTAFMAAAFHGN